MKKYNLKENIEQALIIGVIVGLISGIIVAFITPKIVPSINPSTESTLYDGISGRNSPCVKWEYKLQPGITYFWENNEAMAFFNLNSMNTDKSYDLSEFQGVLVSIKGDNEDYLEFNVHMRDNLQYYNQKTLLVTTEWNNYTILFPTLVRTPWNNPNVPVEYYLTAPLNLDPSQLKEIKGIGFAAKSTNPTQNSIYFDEIYLIPWDSSDMILLSDFSDKIDSYKPDAIINGYELQWIHGYTTSKTINYYTNEISFVAIVLSFLCFIGIVIVGWSSV